MKVFVTGVNGQLGHDVMNSLYYAEIDALSHISYTTNLQLDYSKVKVYIYRVSFGHKSGHGLARPCNGCIQALRDKGIRHIYYSTDDGFAYERLD